ncbi:hypothetical protein BKA80DRAFT_37263 [Phyllosticta citrichinensis]
MGKGEGDYWRWAWVCGSVGRSFGLVLNYFGLAFSPSRVCWDGRWLLCGVGCQGHLFLFLILSRSLSLSLFALALLFALLLLLGLGGVFFFFLLVLGWLPLFNLSS